LTVGFYGSAASTLLPDVMRAFAEQHPSVGVTIRELLLDDIDEIRDGHVDVAFTRLLPGQADADLDVEVLASEARLVALPKNHPLAARDSLRFIELCDEGFIINPVVDSPRPPARWLAEQHRHGLSGRVAAEAASVPEILALVASGRGVCLVPASVARHYARSDVSYVEVSDADPAIVSLVWTPESRRAEVDAFIATAGEVAGGITHRA
jgi:DNA-binding transcriptional LysR family regulator